MADKKKQPGSFVNNTNVKETPGATKFSVEEFNVQDELEQRLISNLQNQRNMSQQSDCGRTSGFQTPQKSQFDSTSNFQFPSLTKESSQTDLPTSQQQKVKSKISDIELL